MQLSTVPIALIRGTWVVGLQVTPWLDLHTAMVLVGPVYEKG